MSCTIVFDWKSFVALGATGVGLIFASKIDSAAAERISLNFINILGEHVVALLSDDESSRRGT